MQIVTEASARDRAKFSICNFQFSIFNSPSAVALCSNRISREQAEKAARLAREFAGGFVTIFLDCDPEGEEGMKQCLGYLAQLCTVRLAWTSKAHRGKRRQPGLVIGEDCTEISSLLRVSSKGSVS